MASAISRAWPGAWAAAAASRPRPRSLPHSPGIFYQALTQYLGFPNYGDEYKVMGLAPYGKPAFLAQMRRIVRLREDGGFELDLAYFRHAKEKADYEWDGGAPVVGTLYSQALVELLGPARGPSEELTQRHRDVARSAQAMYEEAFFHLLAHLHGRYRLDALCLAGGCAMNSVANGKVYARSLFRRLYVQAAAGDAGGAIGAAFVVWHEMSGGAGLSPRPFPRFRGRGTRLARAGVRVHPVPPILKHWKPRIPRPAVLPARSKC